jgi:D-alanine-D-alanine ligase
MTVKRRVVVLFGGRSSEHSISCATAGGVLSAIDRDLFEVVPVGITREGVFVLEEDDPTKFGLDPEHLPEVLDNGSRVLWPEDSTSRELSVVHTDGRTESLGVIDVVFPILHGRYGEDGTVQGLFELVGLPYVGSGVLASSVSMDKHFTKTVLQHAGIAVAPWATVSAAGFRADPGAALRSAVELGYPVFVKPARAGSSVGVSKVEAPDGLSGAIRDALEHDDRVLIESTVIGREVEIAVLEGRNGAEPRTSVAGEIVVSGRGFYDFDAKYLDAPGIDLVCPAPLSDDELAEMSRIAREVFTAVGAEGLARVDFFLTDVGFVVNELNTLPGFTPISMFPKCWLASGLAYPDLITELLEIGAARGAR